MKKNKNKLKTTLVGTKINFWSEKKNAKKGGGKTPMILQYCKVTGKTYTSSAV